MNPAAHPAPVRAFVPLLLASLLAAQQPKPAPETLDDAAVAFFLEEGLQRSQVMEHLSWITDVYGPRLTGSPNMRRAQQWAVEQFGRMGFSNARTEEWGPFGRGWKCEHVSLAVVGENPWPVIGHVKAWSPGLDGRIEADVVDVASMTAQQLEAADVDGKILLIDLPRTVSEPFDAPARRLTPEELLRLADQQRSDAAPAAARAVEALQQNDFRLGFQRRGQMMELINKKKPLALIDGGAKGDYGTIFIAGASAKGRVNARTAGAEVIPQFTIAVEHYNRMCRLLQKGLPVRMALELRVSWSNETLEDHNVLAEIPGADPVIGNQLAMLGAHFDSWQSGTGTTDNGCGSAVVMEASRLLAAWCAKSGTKPRRTIRAALWSGEEQGLLGSRAWVAKHLGTAAQPGPEHGLVSGYFNLDNGTGRIRGVYLQGNEAIAPVFRAWLRPFHVHGASTVTLDDTGGTDHLAFHAVGIPGFQFIQDPVGYGTRTHHSNMDLWDHAVADDLKQASVIMASFAWHTAQRDALLPRPVR
ncbi:MAG: hypothetical protein RIT25_2055 [Planctomycetota bacterium]